MKASVGILMGSDSDMPVMLESVKVLKKFGVEHEVEVSSAHRSPGRTCEYARTAKERGLRVIIAGAGAAAHLAGVIAAETTLPVIGVPIDSSPLKGFDALLATVQMPPGVPVATMAVGKSGATNAALFAVQILANSDAALAARLIEHKKNLVAGVVSKNEKAQEQLKNTE